MATSIGSGIGGFVVAAQQSTYGGMPSFGSARTLGTFKTWTPTLRQHPVQGGPYLRNGELVDIGTARLLQWQDAMATVTGDVANTGMALLLASAMGSNATMTQLGTTTAYGLGGASGFTLSAPDKNNTFMDCQVGVPLTTGTLEAQTYHSGYVTKAVWKFDRQNLVTYSYDIDFQEYEESTSIATPSEPGGPIPFDMAYQSSGSTFKIGGYGSEALVDGVKTCTITIDRKAATERIYLGNQYKDMPVVNDKTKLTVALEADYTSAARTGIFELQAAGTPISIVCTAVGNPIGSSGFSDTFTLNVTNAFVDTGGEAPLAGPDLVKNTINLSGTIDAAGDAALKGILYSADTAF